MKRRIGLIGIGVCVLLGVVFLLARPIQTNPVVIALFGPASRPLHEEYEGRSRQADFDHSEWDGLLKAHVHGFGVDYQGFASDRSALDSYLSHLRVAPLDRLDRDQLLALYINAYNAFTVALILDHLPLESIKEIPSSERWDAVRWGLGGRTLSLTMLEHDLLRENFIEPRIHFAINCASVGCPPLRGEAYLANTIEQQLQQQAERMHHSDRWVRIDEETLYLTPLYLWYASDFETVEPSVLAFAARFRPEVLEKNRTLVWMDYDWSLNQAR